MKQTDDFPRKLLAVGAIVVMLAALWWHSFFRAVAQQYEPGLGETDPTLHAALLCIAYTTPACASALRSAGAEGRTPYQPALFWLGAGITLAGAILQGRSNR